MPVRKGPSGPRADLNGSGVAERVVHARMPAGQSTLTPTNTTPVTLILAPLDSAEKLIIDETATATQVGDLVDIDCSVMFDHLASSAGCFLKFTLSAVGANSTQVLVVQDDVKALNNATTPALTTTLSLSKAVAQLPPDVYSSFTLTVGAGAANSYVGSLASIRLGSGYLHAEQYRGKSA
jgi:hypothetical protein